MYEITRHSEEFDNGLTEFMKVAEENRKKNCREKICCPCKSCQNLNWFCDAIQVSAHIISNGFMRDYVCWYMHGEKIVGENSSVSLFNRVNSDENDVLYNNNNGNNDNGDDNNIGDNDNGENIDNMFNDVEGDIDEHDHDEFQQLLADLKTKVYDGCKYSKFSAVTELLNLKADYGWSDTGFTKLLEFINNLLPTGNKLPKTTYRAKKLICPMWLIKKRIHACPNDCMLYRNENKDLHKCKECGASRYKRNKEINLNDDVTKNGPPAKVLWYLPIIPRLKRLFANAKHAKLLRWHEDERKKDGMIRHVADSPQWRHINNKNPEFESEIRNIRFGLSSDGINPFGDMSSQHSSDGINPFGDMSSQHSSDGINPFGDMSSQHSIYFS
uniref:variant-silencing SET domain-containing protein-like n=1 Tax=Erigeron canadensis TaxID=72917 RepID=UPI001CB94409|nr:variant-silencing SET domain-containing protein-like [Erigeron canadensis]